MSERSPAVRPNSKREQSQTDALPSKKMKNKNRRREDEDFGSGSDSDGELLQTSATPIFVYTSDLKKESSMENGDGINSTKDQQQSSSRSRSSKQDGNEEENQEGDQGEMRPKGRIRVRFTLEEEEDLASWWEKQKFLYVRTVPDYRDLKKKDAAIAAKAKLMNRTAAELKVWMSTTRSRVGRRTEQMRGRHGAPKQLSEREIQLRSRFAFLRDHIYRQPTRQSTKFQTPDSVTARPVDEQTWIPWTWSQEQEPCNETGASSSDVSGMGDSAVKEESASSSSVVTGYSEMQTSLNGTPQREVPVNTDQAEASWQPQTVYRTGFERTVGDYVNLLEGMLLQIDPADFNRFMIQNLSMVSEFQEMAVERRRGSSAMNNSR